MSKILITVGTRPEFIKLFPLIKLFNRNKIILVNTSQHKSLLNKLIKEAKIKFDYNLNVIKKNSLSHLFSSILVKFNKVLKKKPKMVIVQGDTATAAACALASFHNKIPVSHIEAGLRTYNIYKPFPEEIYRQIISRIASINFAPTYLNKKNLLSENIKNRIFVTGNTVFDSILFFLKKRNYNKLNKYFKKKYKIDFLNNKIKILFTCHRRENYGLNFSNICDAINNICKNYKNIEIIYPLHPNPNFFFKAIKNFKKNKQVKLIPPQEYINSLFLIENSRLIISDSGGIQEEAVFFKKYVIVIREETERVEGIQKGFAITSKISSRDIQRKVNNFFKKEKEITKRINLSKNPYLIDGSPSYKIFKIIQKIFN